MAATMTVTVVRPAELGIGEEKLWREFQSTYPVGVHHFFSLIYALAVCRADESGRVAVVEDDGAIRAFIPYTKGDDGVATALGGGQTGLEGLISSNASLDLRRVVRSAGLRGWRFADLRNGYDAYVRALTASVRKRISRIATYRRALQRELGEVSFEWNSSDPSLLPLLLDWKSDQHESVRQWVSDPAIRTLLQDLTGSDNEDCSGVTSSLSPYDPEYSRFSPGTIEWLVLFEEAANRGVEMVDFGYGDDRYKQRFGNATYSVSGGGVWGQPSSVCSPFAVSKSKVP
jgi:CelD/BcsL family acetyltransferase involved in cellulose biosynthesis